MGIMFLYMVRTKQAPNDYKHTTHSSKEMQEEYIYITNVLTKFHYTVWGLGCALSESNNKHPLTLYTKPSGQVWS